MGFKMHVGLKIAVNTRFLLPSKLEGFGWYTYETIRRICEQHPEHEFIFFFDRPYDQKFIFSDNITPVVLQPPARHPILFYIWFEWSVYKALKKYKADVFVSPDGYLSLRSKCKSLAVIHDLNFEHHPEDLPWSARKYLRYFFPRFAKKADRIVTVSHYSKNDIHKTYGIEKSKIDVSYNGANNIFQPVSDLVKDKIKKQYTNCKDYFVFVGALHPRKNIVRLLKAFDLYKTKGGEEKLVIVGEAYWWNKAMENQFSNMSFQNDVIFTGHLKQKDMVEVVASALCLVFVSYFEGFGIPIVEAMRCGVPVITSNISSPPEIAGEAALIVDPYKIDAIAAAMLLIREDEKTRKKLIAMALKRADLFHWDNTANILWKNIAMLIEAPKEKEANTID